ncbi:MAG: tetratricopeptide repeat protein [Vicinamibacteria bacterium]|nr:tetratricopeptide repeat protein [Vicinamibacteria bacterium]
MQTDARALVLTCLLVTMPATTAAVLGQAPPVAFDALRHQAEEARAAGRVDEAVALYKRAVALQPSWTEGYWYLGTIYYDTDRHDECRDAFARVTGQQPDNGAAWAFRGLCEFRLRQYATALDSLNRARQAGVGDDAAFVAVVGYHRAILLARFGQFERALEVDVNLVRGGNTTPAMLDALGIAWLRLSLLPDEVPPEKRDLVQLAGRAAAFRIGMMKDAAQQAFEQLVSRYPDIPNVHYMYGTYLAFDHPDEAIEQFQIELTRSPGHVLARVQIAQELIKRGNFGAARPYATEAARLDPGNFMCRRVLGQVKLQAGEVAGAIADLEAAATLEPSSPSVRFHLARAYRRAGRTADAERERTEFLRLEKLQQVQRGGANAVGGQGEEPQEEKPLDDKPH